MNLLVIDAQGGGFGKQLVTAIKREFSAVEITAVGTNSVATGAMLKAGADCFWELYDPTDPDRSPYGSPVINSCCHAWSCTPAYFFRRYPELTENSSFHSN